MNGQKFHGVMPPVLLNDEQIAQIVAYVMNTWGNSGDLVTVEEVQKIHAESANQSRTSNLNGGRVLSSKFRVTSSVCRRRAMPVATIALDVREELRAGDQPFPRFSVVILICHGTPWASRRSRHGRRG